MTLYTVLTLCVMIISCGASSPQLESSDQDPHERDSDVKQRIRRDIYTTFQDRAQAMCIGLCMFQERKTYFKCESRCKIGMPKEFRMGDDMKESKESKQRRKRRQNKEH